jgi:hypothetical protein
MMADETSPTARAKTDPGAKEPAVKTAVEVVEEIIRPCQVTVSDGSVISFKPMIRSISRLDRWDDENGMPLYDISFVTHAMVISADPRHKK